MKAQQKFSDSKFGRVLPFAMVCFIAGEFVACGNKNGAREFITPGVKQINTKSMQGKGNDPELKKRLKAASAKKVQHADGSFTVTVSLLIANPNKPDNLWVVSTVESPVPVSLKAQGVASPSATASVGETLDNKNSTLTAAGAPGARAGEGKSVELEIDGKISARELAQVQAKVHALCKNAECSQLTVVYCEQAANDPASFVDREASSVAVSVNGANAGNNKLGGATNGSSGRSVKMHFVDAGDKSGLMGLDPNCRADLPCNLPDFQSAVIAAQAAAAKGVTLSPQPQGPPSPTDAANVPADGATNTNTNTNTDAQSAAHTPPEQHAGETTTAAAAQTNPGGESSPAAAAATNPEAGTKGQDGAPGATDNQ